MHFLKTLFWVVVAVFLAILASRNWHDVTLNLWGDIQADIKVPVLILAMFLIGWLPTFLVYRAKMWRLRQRLDSQERQASLRVGAAAQRRRAGRMSPIFVAIDTPDLERARSLAQQVQADAGGVKLGLEFFSANGPAGVAVDPRTGTAGFPRSEAARHSEHGRQGGRGACGRWSRQC